MIICTKCGFQNSDDAGFCGSCGSFLEWTGEKVQPQTAPPPEPEPTETEPERGGLLVQARRALGLEEKPGGEAAGATGGRAEGAALDAATGPNAGVVAGSSAAVSPPSVAPTPVVVSTRRVAPAVEFDTIDTSATATVEAAPSVPAPTGAAPEIPAAGAQPAAVQPAAVQPAAVRPAAVRPAAGQPEAAQPAAAQPGALKPGMARPRPTPAPVAPLEEGPRPGELVCGSCGTGNEPTRRFCHRCGAYLAVVPVARRVPWWRSLFTRRATAMPAGARPLSVQRQAAQAAGGGGGTLRKLLAVILIGAIVVGAAGFVLVPGVRDAVEGAVNQVRVAVAPNYVPVHVAGQATGPSIAGHGPNLAFDSFSNTYWAAPASESQPWISATFSPPADIAKVLITSGDPDNFEAQPRPHTIRLDFMNAKGAVVFTRQFDLQDAKDFQTLDVDARGAASIKLTVLSVYQSTAGQNVSVADIEFRSRQ
ncbi:MAG: zinc-ribbon domain-containing protein [Candidatus Limnocylindrales bacterium]